jgi:hypothetical protein
MSTLIQRMKDYMQSNPSYSRLIRGGEMLRADNDSPTGPEDEIKKYYTFDDTGHIMISSTVAEEKDMDPGVKAVFQKAQVFFGAWTAAIAQKGRSMYDYDAINAVIAQSGYFINMGTEDRTFNYTSHDVVVSTAIVEDALGSIAAGGSALRIASNIIKGLGGQLQVSSEHTDEHQKIAQLMFVCQNLMGMPLVSATLYYIQRDETKDITKTNCSSTYTDTIQFAYHKQDFMFVDPDVINKCSDDFKQSDAYKALIASLAKAIPDKT